MLRRLRLGDCNLSHLLSPSSPRAASPRPPILPIHRFLSATATPFAVEDYLVATCRLTPAQALKASKALSHLKSPSRPEAVVAFLSGLGISGADIAAAVAKDPKLLCSDVEGTLAPRVAELRNFGLSTSQIARFVLVDPKQSRLPTVVSKLQFYVPLFGSFENLLRAIRRNHYLLGYDLEGVVKPNVALLVECGLDACVIAKMSVSSPRLITTNPERVQEMVEHAEALGVPRGTRLFRNALVAVAFLTNEKITAKVKLLMQTFRWSDAEVGVAVSKWPLMLRYSKDRLDRMSEFLITQVGLEPEYIAQRPNLLSYSLEHRLMPRHYVLKFLKENGLSEHRQSYFTIVRLSEKNFIDKFIRPYKEAAPNLAQDYAAACRAKVTTTL